MRTRLLIHYLDGGTFRGEWNKTYNFDDLKTKYVSSVQIQSDKKTYTLSAKKKQAGKFHQCDVLGEDILERVITKWISENIVIMLIIDCKTGKRRIFLRETNAKYINNKN